MNEETQARLQRLRDTTLEAIELFKLAKEARKQAEGIGTPEDLRRALVNSHHTLCSTATKLLQGIEA